MQENVVSVIFAEMVPFFLLLLALPLPGSPEASTASKCTNDCVLKLQGHLNNIDACAIPYPCFWGNVVCEVGTDPCKSEAMCWTLLHQPKEQLLCGWAGTKVVTSTVNSAPGEKESPTGIYHCKPPFYRNCFGN
jgi:hypothetical protein